MKPLYLLLLATSLTAACACSEANDTGTGTVTFTAWGEDYIEDEIPSDAFADGWSVKYDRFLVVLTDIEVRAQTGGEGGDLHESQCLDLTEPGPHELGTLELDARAWTRVGYEFHTATTETTAQTSASDSERKLMLNGGYSVFASGTATNGDESKTFAWGFTSETSFTNCVADIDGKETEGFVLGRGGAETVELTIHGDHLFYDDLGSPDAKRRFAPIAAADADEDGEVTLEELRNVELIDIPEGTYGTASFSDVNDLGAFITALTATLGHFRGEGHCTSTVL